MPIMCLLFLPVDLEELVESGEAAQSLSNLLYLPAIKSMRKKLLERNIPILGFYVRERDQPSILAQLVRKHWVHAVFTNEIYGNQKHFKAISRVIPCPLFALDSDYLLPPRYVEPGTNENDHVESLLQVLGTMQELGPMCKNAEPSIQKPLYLCKLKQKVVYVDRQISDRWNKVEWPVLLNWLTSSYNSEYLKVRSFWTEDTATEILSRIEEHITSNSPLPDNFLCDDLLSAQMMSMVRSGVLSAIQVLLHLKELGERAKPLIKQILQRERKVYISYRQIISHNQKSTNSPNDSGENLVFKSIAKSLKGQDNPESYPQWLVFIREKALQQLAKGEGEGNRSEIYLPGDIEGANTSDTWFNAFQTFLVTKGFLPITALAYWFQRVILFFRESFQGMLHSPNKWHTQTLRY